MLKHCVNFLTSLRLTVVCLGLAIIVVFVGTLAEVRIGLYAAQAEIFRSFFVHWTPPGTHLQNTGLSGRLAHRPGAAGKFARGPYPAISIQHERKSAFCSFTPA